MSEEKTKIQGTVSDKYFIGSSSYTRTYKWTIDGGMNDNNRKKLLENLKGSTRKSACKFSIETGTNKYEYQGPCDKFVELLNADLFFLNALLLFRIAILY